jgi:hypothetical protein
MKANITVLCLTLCLSACALQPTPITTANGSRGYNMDCSSGIETCYQKATELCPNGYDILEHSEKTSAVIPHYGEYPMILHRENLLIECK